jgi:polysaccharide export outer membrane protein
MRTNGCFRHTAAIGCTFLFLLGCAQRCYRANQLPHELQAPPTTSSYHENIAQLARSLPPPEVIQPGDLLELLLLPYSGDNSSKPIPIRVSDQGSIQVPLVGNIFVAGLSVAEAESAIARAAQERGIYQNPVVVLTIKKPRSNRITVLGAVRKEGVYELPIAQSTLLDALVAAGNLSEDADARIEIYRSRTVATRKSNSVLNVSASTSSVSSKFDDSESQPAGSATEAVVVDLAKLGAKGGDAYLLEDGDIVIVPRRLKQSVYVLGLVNRPGKIDLPPDQELYLLDALAMAGGRSSELADRVEILRHRSSTGEPVRIMASVREAKRNPDANIRLAPGDVISVEDTPITMLERMLRYFLRIGVSASVPIL